MHALSTREEHEKEARAEFRLTSKRAVSEHTARWLAEETRNGERPMPYPNGYEPHTPA